MSTSAGGVSDTLRINAVRRSKRGNVVSYTPIVGYYMRTGIERVSGFAGQPNS